ncbi:MULTISPECIES: hypothetical protein [unclassified Listeria]|uniref:hypothetical protein n=1 Tax=unclassified Listeria TaxID=2642072 RepID=UPI000B58BB2D|nr:MULTISPECIES: hypothetical protein [unclassified Listeria]
MLAMTIGISVTIVVFFTFFVIVAIAIKNSFKRQKQETTTDSVMINLTEPQKMEVLDLIYRQNKILAVKMIMDWQPGVSIATAKKYVDNLSMSDLSKVPLPHAFEESTIKK